MRFAVGAATFFGIVVSIGVLLALVAMEDGAPTLVAAATGAIVGFFSAYFVFFVFLNVASWIRNWVGGEKKTRDL